MTPRQRVRLLCGTGLFASSLLIAQPPSDLSGPWSFQVTLTLSGETPVECTFEGTANVIHTGSTLEGSAVMTLIDGEPPCPAESTAQLTGQVIDGTVVEILLDGGNLGVASLLGEHTEGSQFAGAMGMEKGPIDATGTWIASRGTAMLSIPTLGVVGAVALMLLLASASLVLLRARTLA